GRAVAGRGRHAGEHRRRLAEAHVEGEAATESDDVEEAQPGQGLGLVAAQLTAEAVGFDDGIEGDGLRLLEDVGGPAGAFDEDAPGEWRALEADGVAQDLGARELPGRFP